MCLLFVHIVLEYFFKDVNEIMIMCFVKNCNLNALFKALNVMALVFCHYALK